MSSTNAIIRYNVAAYDDQNNLLGYVSTIQPNLSCVRTTVLQKEKFRFNKKRAISIKRSAEVSTIVTIFKDRKTKEKIKDLYPSKDNLRFDIVLEV